MTKKIIIAVAIVVLGAVLITVILWSTNTLQSGKTQKTELLYTAKEVNLSFAYPSSLFLHKVAATESREVLALTLVENTKENIEVITGASKVPREGPTSISLRVYDNPGKVSLVQFLSSVDEWKLSDKRTEETIVGGANAFTFGWDGLYRGKTTAVSNGEHFYVFTVTYLTSEDQLLKEEEAIRSSVVFLRK